MPWRARGYNEEIHVLLDDRALAPEVLDRELAPPTLVDADVMRREIWRVGSTHPDEAIRKRFLERWPNVDSFDRWAFKEFLALNPDAAAVLGIDVMPPFSANPSVREVLVKAARHPDDDKRNQSRFAHDEERNVRKDQWGEPLPADPAQLVLGGMTGTSSQAHAHYGLPKVEFSDDTGVLKEEPHRWSYHPNPRAFAADFTQLFTDLAICAATIGRPGGAALGWMYLGHAHHYLQDVANQIHTLQAIYPFFEDAWWQEKKEDFLSMGGLLRSRPDLKAIGIQIILNHHLLAEDLFAERVQDHLAGRTSHPQVVEAVGMVGKGDGAIELAFDARKIGPDDPFGRVLAEEVIEASSREGAEVYALIRSLAQGKLSKAGGKYGAGDDPDAFLVRVPDEKKLERFYRLQTAGFARAGSAVRRHVQLYQAAVEPALASEEARTARFEAAARRLVASQVAYLDERDARLAAYVPKPPATEKIDWRWPAGQVGGLLLIVGLVVWRVRRRRKRRVKLVTPAPRATATKPASAGPDKAPPASAPSKPPARLSGPQPIERPSKPPPLPPPDDKR